MTDKTLFDPIKIGAVELKNRIVMAPLTRGRAEQGTFVPKDMHVEYYTQRASAGLIITEATQVHRSALGYINTPGIYSDEQVTAWKKVTDSVHANGGKIFLQMWHVGRISHPSMQENGETPMAPSAINPNMDVYTYEGPQKTVTPREMTKEDIKQVVQWFGDSAENAKKAGFDGVEIHGANGYLIDQFIRDGSNKREDDYGGSVENRARFLMEIKDAVIAAWGDAGHVGIRLSPTHTFNSMTDSNPAETFSYIAAQLSKDNLAYIHIVEPVRDIDRMPIPEGTKHVAQNIHEAYTGTFMMNGGFSKELGNEAIANSKADLVSFGVPFISNPDLVERFKNNWPLNEADGSTFYGGDEKGYTDYPFYNKSEAA